VLSQHCSNFQGENEMLRREIQALRMENQQFRSDLAAMSATHPAGSHAAGPQSLPDAYARAAPRPELPPLRALSGALPNGGPESMTGVQYEQPRPNGYRPPERF
jgi:hypothetical protein